MRNKLLAALLSLVVAFALWAYVITDVSPGAEERFSNIPVVMNGESYLEDHELMVTSSLDKTVTLRLAGNRSDLNKLNASNIKVSVDLTKIYSAGEYKLPYEIAYPGDVASNAVTVQNRDPSEITVTVENRKSSRVPVTIVYEGTVPDGYITDKDNAVLDNDKIMVTGPESVINQITMAKINVSLEGRTESLSESYKITLCDSSGNPVDVQLVTTSVTEVHLDLKIQRVKEVELALHVISGGGATQENSSIVIEPATIRVAGSEAALNQLEKLEIGEINLGDFTSDGEKTFAIDTLLPVGLTNLTGVKEATVKISFPKLKTKEFSVKNITALNVPANLDVTLLTEALTVKIRGAIALVDAIKAEDLAVVVDFTDAQVGTASVKAKIVIPTVYAGVGELGTYSVYAEVKEKDKT